MTKKHFIAAAKMIAAIENPTTRAVSAAVVANVAVQVNSNFDRERFAAACNVPVKGLLDAPCLIERHSTQPV